MHEPKVDRLPRAVLTEEHDVLVRWPDSLLDVPLRLLQAFGKLTRLTLVKTQLLCLVVDVFPSECLARVLAQASDPQVERATVFGSVMTYSGREHEMGQR